MQESSMREGVKPEVSLEYSFIIPTPGQGNESGAVELAIRFPCVSVRLERTPAESSFHPRRRPWRIELITWPRTKRRKEHGAAGQDCERLVVCGAGVLFVLHHVSGS